jgi:prepilin-type N-terminal cleavage/methylation domain-containing protein
MKRTLSPNGFTLIEMLVVVTIIGILVSISIPTLSGVIQNAKKVEAKAFMSGMQQSLASYRTEYNNWPPFMRVTGDTDRKLENVGDWTDFYGTMTAKTDYPGLDTENRRRIRFLDVPTKYLNDTQNPTSATHFVDPWNQLYVMWVDANYDGVLRGLPNIQSGDPAGYDMPGEIAVWSRANDSGAADSASIKKSVATWR